MHELNTWAKAMPQPKNILMISAHWEHKPVALGATKTVPLVYDFYGFPEHYYQTKYPAPGSPHLAARVRELLQLKNTACIDEPERGLDHGAYVPLVAMYPMADVPILQMSLPKLDAQELFALGQALAPLCNDGTLVFGSGFLTHNMNYAFRPGIPSWAQEFDDWAAAALSHFNIDELVNFQERAPAVRLALPTWEHFAPLLVSVGAAGTIPKITFPISGWWLESPFTKRSVQFG